MVHRASSAGRGGPLARSRLVHQILHGKHDFPRPQPFTRGDRRIRPPAWPNHGRLPGLSAVCWILMPVGTACATGGPTVDDLMPDAAGVTTTRSGLKYEVLTQGDGPRPTARDRVLLHYSCARADGTVVDSSYERGQPEVLALRDLIRGFREALQLMPVGSHIRVAVPGRLAYGWEGMEGVIGPNEPLLFEIQLYSIVEN